MKNYSDYKRVVAKNYPQLKDFKLTKSKFEQLEEAWEYGAPEGYEGLLYGACHFAFDFVSRLYENRVLRGDFEDTLQDTFMILKTAGQNKFVSENVRQKVAGKMPRDYGMFLKMVADCVAYSLIETREKDKNEKIDIQPALNDSKSASIIRAYSLK